jgi:hypothetical protein
MADRGVDQRHQKDQDKECDGWHVWSASV